MHFVSTCIKFIVLNFLHLEAFQVLVLCLEFTTCCVILIFVHQMFLIKKIERAQIDVFICFSKLPSGY